MDFKKSLQIRYEHCPEIRDALVGLCEEYLIRLFSDTQSLQYICERNDEKYWQKLSEFLIAYLLEKSGHQLQRTKEGPDLNLICDQKKVWIEIVTPEPKQLPSDWQEINHLTARWTPHDKLLLRWTAAISDKYKKYQKYLNEIIGADDICIIAINGRLLRGSAGFPAFYGASRYPYAVEAVFPVGPLAAIIDSQTSKLIEQRNVFRSSVGNHNNSPVSTNLFFDEEYKQISAIWAFDIDESILIGNRVPNAIVHNPLANQILPSKFLPSFDEYSGKIIGNYFELERSEGRLS